MNTYSNKFDISYADKIKSFLLENDFTVKQLPYTIFRAKSNICTITFYETGKLLMQGSEVGEIAKKFEEYMGLTPTITNFTNAETVSNNYSRYIGVDESGKGDFFGPLVIGGVLLTPENKDLFIKLGVKDSKKLNDSIIKKMALEIQKNATFSTVVIMPEKYNQLYDKFKNLNKLLAWGHARVIENILEKEECEYAISDKFGKDEFIQEALLEKGRKIKLDQFCKGEEDIAVAAASIIARAEFVNRIQSMENYFGVTIPKGASGNVVDYAQIFCDKYGKNRLNEVAKMHFKTSQNVK